MFPACGLNRGVVVDTATAVGSSRWHTRHFLLLLTLVLEMQYTLELRLAYVGRSSEDTGSCVEAGSSNFKPPAFHSFCCAIAAALACFFSRASSALASMQSSANTGTQSTNGMPLIARSSKLKPLLLEVSHGRLNTERHSVSVQLQLHLPLA